MKNESSVISHTYTKLGKKSYFGMIDQIEYFTCSYSGSYMELMWQALRGMVVS